MKNLLIILSFLLPLAAFAGGGSKNEKIDIQINTDKKGKVTITGLKGKDLKKLEKKINEALKDVTINFDDGKENHVVHLKADINIE
jgi:ribosomal protein S3